MRRGELTPVELLDQCLGRIDRYEPAVRAWVVVDLDGAREQAERLTAELKRGEDRGPLHGIPIGVKDIIDVFDLPTGCGSRLWANSVARQDAACVKRLRQAGAVVLGKTVTTAYAYLDPPATRNPWNLERTPGGSSSGSAAAVACGMCLAALGTQTVGSLTRPASYCGVCSLKPTYLHVPTDGVLPLAPTLDHVGVIARSVADLATVGNYLTTDDDDFRVGMEEVDWIDSRRPYHIFTLGPEALDRAEPAMRTAFDHVVQSVTNHVRWVPFAPTAATVEIPRHLRAILAVQAAAYHGDRLRRHPDDYPPKIRDLVEAGGRMSAVEYERALDHWRGAWTTMDRTFFHDKMLMTPAATGPAQAASTTGDAFFNAPWSYTGRPTVSLPVGRDENDLPLAVQFVGNDEVSLFATAAWLEREVAYDMRLPPVPTAP